MNANFPKRGEALVVVAHPDDEILWCGALIMRYSELNWTIVSVCRASDSDRRPRFRASCSELGCRGFILDIDDSPELCCLDLNADIIDPLLAILPDKPWDICLTHGYNGEYGHQRHIDVHQAVSAMVETDQLNCRTFWSFAYTGNAKDGMTTLPDADTVLELSGQEIQTKRQMVQRVYGFPPGSFEWNACIDREGFRCIH